VPKYSVALTFDADSDEHAKALTLAVEDAANMVLLDGESLQPQHRFKVEPNDLQRAELAVHWKVVA
jgi:hypothetical protein